MSLLTIIQSVCPRLALATPTIVIGSTDPQVKQLQALLEELGQVLVTDYKWQVLRRSATWTSTATVSQGSLATRAGADFKAIVPETFWNFTLRRPVFGPIDDKDWQMLQAFIPGGPIYQYRISENLIQINPTPVAGQSYGFIWESRYWILDPDGTTRKEAFTDDDDTCLFDEKMLQVGLQARWNEEKGLPYAELQQRFTNMVNTYQMRDATKPTLSMDQAGSRLVPGIFVPAGNWPV